MSESCLPEPCLPSEVKARCNSAVMASKRTGVSCSAPAATGSARTKTETATQKAPFRTARIEKAEELWGKGLEVSGLCISIFDCLRVGYCQGETP